jgi:hypothetical protein
MYQFFGQRKTLDDLADPGVGRDVDFNDVALLGLRRQVVGERTV